MAKLLLITRNAWSNSISTGNTMTNFFDNWMGDIANLYCRDEKIDNRVCKKYFRITESQLVRSFFKQEEVGEKIYFSDFSEMERKFLVTDSNIEQETKKYSFFRNHRWTILLWARELIWKLGKWKNHNLEDFLNEYNPDVILIPMYDCLYMYDILFYVHKKTNAKIVLYTGDDMYTLKQFSLSPLYWINRIFCRAKIRKAVELSAFRFCLSEKQMKEYDTIFKKKFNVFMKGAKNIEPIRDRQERFPITLLYTGNITQGRYRVLGLIGKAIKSLNSLEPQVCLNVYSGNRLTRKMKKTFETSGVQFHGSVDSATVSELQRNADVVVHVEDFSLRNKLKVRLSVSTKIVDYLAMSKCIFAVGPKDVASMEYLIENDVALIATEKEQIATVLRNLVNNTQLIKRYEEKAMECAKQKHQINEMQKELYWNINNLV